jgi:phosphoserine phosphatase
MLQVAGLSVGYLPKDAVRPHCDIVVAKMARLARVFEDHGILSTETSAQD